MASALNLVMLYLCINLFSNLELILINGRTQLGKVCAEAIEVCQHLLIPNPKSISIVSYCKKIKI